MLVSIHQPNYLPRAKVIDKILAVDLVVVHDNVQYVSREWQNRALVRRSNGNTRWLTVPVLTKGKPTQLIKNCAIVNDMNWPHKHLESIRDFYHGSRWMPLFDEHLAPLWEVPWTELESLCMESTTRLLSALGRHAEFVYSQNLSNDEFSRSVTASAAERDDAISAGDVRLRRSIRRTAQLVDICRSVGATGYVSGSGGLSYLIPDLFRAAGIKLYLQRDSATDQSAWKSLSLVDSLLVRGPGETGTTLLKGNYDELF